MTQLFISIIFILTLYGRIQTTEWQTLNFGSFTLKTPKGWIIFKKRGEDAFIGGITNGKDSMSYYLGRYIKGFKNLDTSKYLLLQERINAKVADIKIPKNKVKGEISMFVDSAYGMNKFALWTENMNDSSLILKIFKSVQFK